MNSYDYIILGAGASGLMLAYRMAKDPFFDDKSILLIDKDSYKGNDRTWCFWEKGKGEWDSILHKSWNSIYFGGTTFSKTIDILPYKYKMIRSEKFYNLLWETIRLKSNIEYKTAAFESYTETKDLVSVRTSYGDFTTHILFNSIPNAEFLNQKKYPSLQQHFLGWFIKTKDDFFDDTTATFMDFSVPQNGNTRFMYVLPINKKEALFEYTLFSKDILKKEVYEKAIKDYLSNRNIVDYDIIETEAGAIPMSSYKFSVKNTEKVLHIGTAGGWTKASTGYTFMSTTKKTKALIEILKKGNSISNLKGQRKFWFYDLILLDVLSKYNDKGAELFTSMFKKTDIHTIFKFLDEESKVWEDLKIIFSVPPKHFALAVLKRLFNR